MYVNEKFEAFRTRMIGKKVAVIGMGVSNTPLIRYLINLKSEITVFDKREEDKLDPVTYEEFKSKGVNFSLGVGYLDALEGFDYIFRSPSMRPDLEEVQKEVSRGAILTSEIEMVLKLCPGTIIGVTGSDGKTTTTTLIYKMLCEEGYNCYLGGNIGTPLFADIDKMKPDDFVVLELSSFQLMTARVSPQIAVITNIAPNHLDIHKDYEEYINAKKNIFLYQKEDGLLVLNYDNEITKPFEEEAKGKVRFFSTHSELSNGVILGDDDSKIYICENGDKREVIKADEVKLLGRHNLENVCTAIAAIKELVSVNSIRNVLTTFNGVEHRNELVRVVDEVEWRNDSIGSSPSRTIAGLLSYKDKVILIAGGYDKHLDYTELGIYIVSHVKSLILIGQTAEAIKEATLKAMKEQNIAEEELKIFDCTTLEEAVSVARELSVNGDVVLFSPASASFDMFKNFEERGNKFKELVNAL
ncbi:MAG: UDP-N-acetylmuramoyl-L-alanine--D-glutamate ligase [Clostridia bacterium]|nr:UDP-N-acetylmuramoyl-L-alanine--D-glutamate ligase [Clostridia bacterium]